MNEFQGVGGTGEECSERIFPEKIENTRGSRSSPAAADRGDFVTGERVRNQPHRENASPETSATVSDNSSIRDCCLSGTR